MMHDNSQILLYQTEDGQTKIEVRLENETVWLNQEQISELFQRERSVITKHINNVFKAGELNEDAEAEVKKLSELLLVERETMKLRLDYHDKQTWTSPNK